MDLPKSKKILSLFYSLEKIFEVKEIIDFDSKNLQMGDYDKVLACEINFNTYSSNGANSHDIYNVTNLLEL